MHSFTQRLISEFIPAFSRTLAHSLWQGIAAAVLAGVVIGCTRNAPAVKRYNGLVAVYVLFALTVVVTFFYEMGSPAPAIKKATSNVVQQRERVVMEAGTAVSTPVDESMGAKVLAVINDNAVLVTGLWALLFLVQATRMGFGLRYVQTVKKGGTRPVNEEWTTWIRKTGHLLGIRQTVVLLQSEKIKVPVAVGFLKPLILVPVGLMARLSTEQVEAVLLHELAHIRRKDYLVNLVQSLADAVFFFNPAVRWLSACIRDERETCCDNTVVEHTGNKKGYVEALVSFSQLSPSPVYAMAIGSKKTHLLNRVKTIITRENSRLTFREQAGLVLGAVAIMTFGAFTVRPEGPKTGKNPVNQNEHAATVKTDSPAGRLPRDKRQVKPLSPKQLADTVPQPKPKQTEPVKWRNLSTNTNDDGQEQTTQVIATAEDGTVYRLRKIGPDVVLFSVNGREIAKEDYPQHYTAMDAIEQSLKQRRADALKAQESRLAALQQKQELLAQKRARLDEQRKNNLLQKLEMHQREQSLLREKDLQALLEKKEPLKKELALLNKEREKAARDGEMALLERQRYEQERKEYNRTNENYQSLLRDYQADNHKLYNKQKIALSTNSSVAAILADLTAAGLVENENKLSFALNSNELVVNGKTADKGLFEKLKTKYVRHNGDRYEYFKDGGTTRTTINLE